MLFPTPQDIFKIKESGTKFKTKIQKLAFIQSCAEQLSNSTYDTKQLRNIKEFFKKKAVNNSIVQPAELFLKAEKFISELKIPELVDHIKTFHQLQCKRAKNLVACYILYCSIKYCTNAAEIQFSNGLLLVLQFSFDKHMFKFNLQE